jgi:hypothetical protein
MKKLSDENFTYPAGTSVVSKQGGASDLPEPYAAQRDIKIACLRQQGVASSFETVESRLIGPN